MNGSITLREELLPWLMNFLVNNNATESPSGNTCHMPIVSKRGIMLSFVKTETNNCTWQVQEDQVLLINPIPVTDMRPANT